MKRALLTALVATLALVPAATQDFRIPTVTSGPGGGALSSQMLERLPTSRSLTDIANLSPQSPDQLFAGTDVAAGDFNGDGINDIAVTQGGPGGGSLTIYAGEGDGTFGLPLSLPVMNGPISVASGDIDMDGLADIVVGGVDYPSDVSGQLQVFSGSYLQQGTFGDFGGGLPGTEWLDGVPTSVSIGRLNGDAAADIAIGLDFGGELGGVQTFTGGGPGGAMFSGAGTLFVPEGPVSDVTLSNGLNAPGGADIFVATGNGIEAFESDISPSSVPLNSLLQFHSAGEIGAGFFGQAGLGMTSGPSPLDVVVSDVNDDDMLDLMALNRGSGTVTTFMGNPGGYDAPRTSLAGANPLGLTTLNFNNDGFPDIAVATGPGVGSPGGVNLLQGNGTGGFTMSGTLGLDAWPNVLSVSINNGAIVNGAQTLNITAFCSSNPAACGGNGLRLPNEQTGVSAGTAAPSTASRMGSNHVNPGDLVARLGRLLGGLLSLGRPQPLASARYSVFATRQMRAQVEPKQVIITATGQSSGDFFRMEIVDRSGDVHRGSLPEGVILEPIALAPAPPPAGANLVTQDVSGYCMDFAKEVPKPGTRYRIANAAAQAQAAPVRNVLAAAKQMAMRNLLHTDGTQGYINFVRQYAVWAKREGWDLKKFGESFVERTKKNVVAAGANWTGVMEEGVRAAIPGRWRDIEEVLRLSNQIAAGPARAR